jgi:hypothetical protein
MTDSNEVLFDIITDENKLPTLKETQEFVKGYIEVITLPNDDILVINEEGKLKDLPYNSKASEVWVSHFGMTDAIVGNALLIKANARDGERW